MELFNKKGTDHDPDESMEGGTGAGLSRLATNCRMPMDQRVKPIGLVEASSQQLQVLFCNNCWRPVQAPSFADSLVCLRLSSSITVKP
ncbi:hypothetical protein H6P81_003108 [Aristolochia fimbriata]|uniref:Uncharacterized protein n=1 Tax=Aristolochia fimbriata TaxID=158543 RepID=A0AAV7FBM3_ARIFI|nr:hypothetical protein H6P81_003108 [Aristolochia fimbriata]